jgi:hypothetical protein
MGPVLLVGLMCLALQVPCETSTITLELGHHWQITESQMTHHSADRFTTRCSTSFGSPYIVGTTGPRVVPSRRPRALRPCRRSSSSTGRAPALRRRRRAPRASGRAARRDAGQVRRRLNRVRWVVAVPGAHSLSQALGCGQVCRRHRPHTAPGVSS